MQRLALPVILVVFVDAIGGCASPPAPQRPASPRRWQVSATTGPAAATTQAAPAEDIPVLLREALAPPSGPQPYEIGLKMTSVYENAPAAEFKEELDLDLEGVLAPQPSVQPRELAASMSLQRIRVRIQRSSGSDPIRSIEFDSRDPAEPTALHRLLAPLVGASLRLTVTPAGQLRQLRGVTAIMRDRRLGIPPELSSLQPILTDAGFQRLVAGALFPAMPSTSLKLGDRWEATVSGSPFDPVATLAFLKGGIVSIASDKSGLPVVTVETKGPIRPAIPQTESTRLVGAQQTTGAVSWNDHSLRQRTVRKLEFTPSADPTDGEKSQRFARSETWTAARRGAATQDEDR